MKKWFQQTQAYETYTILRKVTLKDFKEWFWSYWQTTQAYRTYKILKIATQ